MRCSLLPSHRIRATVGSALSTKNGASRAPPQLGNVPSTISHRRPTISSTSSSSTSTSASSPGRASFSPSGTGTALFYITPSDTTNKAKLAAAGLLAAGFASMAFANALWYSAAFLISWRAVLAANSPAAVARASSLALAAKAFAISYAVSQASKVPRGAAILLLAPAADRVLGSVSRKTKLTKWQLAGGVGVACLALLLAVIATTVGATAAMKAVAATTK